MRIGLDFDGLISNCAHSKERVAKEFFGKKIAPEKFLKEILVRENLLTAVQYKELQGIVYNNAEINRQMRPVEGAIEYINRLKDDGHALEVVTSRTTSSTLMAIEWMNSQGIFIPATGVGVGVSKSDACKGFDVYADDDLDKLEPLAKVVKNLYLFTWGYNKHLIIPNDFAQRVESWKQLYECIKTIEKFRQKTLSV